MHTIQLAGRFVRDDWGGTETVIFEVSRRLIAMGHPTEILCTRATAHSDSDTLDGVHVQRFPYFYPYIGLTPEARHQLDWKGGNPFSFPLMRALREYPELDLIHLHTGHHMGGIGRHIARARNIPYVISLHGGLFDVPEQEKAALSAPTTGALNYGGLLASWVGTDKVLEEADAIICVGYPEQVKVQEHFPDRKVVYVPNGADTARFAAGDGPAFRQTHGIPHDARVLLTMARFDSQKNQLLPVRMLPALLEVDPKIHLLFIGNVTVPEYHDEVERMIDGQGLRDHVTIVQGIPVDDPALVDAYHSADFFVLPSIHEPFGIVILEAWSAGLPVIASRIGGIPHFVEDGKDGILFDPEDEAGFLEAIRAALTDPAATSALAERGKRKVTEKYDWDVVAANTLKLYEEVIRDHTRRAPQIS